MDYFSLVGIIFTAPGMLVTLFLVNKIGLKVNNTVININISVCYYAVVHTCWYLFHLPGFYDSHGGNLPHPGVWYRATPEVLSGAGGSLPGSSGAPLHNSHHYSGN